MLVKEDIIVGQILQEMSLKMVQKQILELKHITLEQFLL
jgi:hypothetical protein